ncbi:filamentous hemagglutinin N-terminal domain-containing protein [Calothrix sp. FACHB-1219]|nr:filamentous hemagglutinin N-terminal domain-containing protein [Calothrix sp. FACHB-168]MBD2219331.1 filamentous hemagglutinin N-terminal domain-containing protein [Calothrix sp. FACHB-1219]
MSYDKPLRIYTRILSFWLLPSALFVLSPAQAQITPDNTLGAESSRLTPNVLINNANADQIDGGAQRGSNLFHSFSDFNINNGQRVYFGNPTGVQNILTRVTGGQASNILGTLGVNGNANLFLINPNGILFGQNARLDIRGAFTATTANSLLFPNGVEFSATNPQSPPLLTINVPIGLQFGSQAGSITSQAVSRDENGNYVDGLVAGSGSTLALIGGEITLDDSFLLAENGQVKLGSVGGNTTVGLDVNGFSLGFNFPQNIERAAINLTNGSFIVTRGNSAIELFGGQISLNGSFIAGRNGGSVVVDAIQLSLNGSVIESLTNSATKGGDITINATQLSLNGSVIESLTNSTNKGGNIQIQARDAVNLTNSSRISSKSNASATGASGDITIDATQLSLNDSIIASSTNIASKGGNIQIQVSDAVNLTDNSFIASDSRASATGAGGDITGDITIDATQLSLNSSGILSLTRGAAKGGNIQIQVSDAVNLTNSSNIFSRSRDSATGAGGDVTINGGKITIESSSGISAWTDSTNSKGNGGNLTLNAIESVNINGGIIFVATESVNNAGNLTVRAKDEINVTNQGTLLISSSSSGSTGNLRIETGTLRVQNNFPGGGVAAIAFGSGSVGSISIQARDAVEVIDSRIFTNVSPKNISPAKAGDITIETQRLNLKDGGDISTMTFTSANAANIFIKASEYVEISGVSPFVNLSRVSSATNSTAKGNAGNVTIETPRLSLTQGGNISTTSVNSNGNAGNITIRAKDVELDGFVFVPKEKLNPLNDPGTAELLSQPLQQEILSRFGGFDYASRILSDVIGSNADVRGGTITIDTERLRLTNGGNISASVLVGRGQGGNLVVRATDSINITGVGEERLDGSFAPSGLFAELQTGGIGSGGSIDVTTGSLNLSNQGEISASTLGQGNAGSIGINAAQIDLRGNSKVRTQVNKEATGNAGNLSIITQLLNVQEESQIISGTFGNGNANNLTVKADNIILTGSDSDLFTGIASSVSERANGKGGDIDITTNNLLIRDSAAIASSSVGTGEAGDIRLNANFLEINGKGSGIVSSTNAGNGGDITLDIGNLLLLRRGGLISSTAGRIQAGGDGGNITINSPFIVAIPNENSDIRANAFTGKGGNVTISTQAIFGIEARPQQTNQSDITASSDLGVQGQITITQPQVQPPQKLIELPTGLVDASTKFAQICPRGRYAKPLGSFVVTGRGSLPLNTLEPLTGTNNLSPLATLDGEIVNSQNDAGTQIKQDAVNYAPIVEAQGLVKTADGNIILVAQAPTATPAATSSSAVCPGS